MDSEIQPMPALGSLLHEVTRLLKRRFEEEARQHGLTLPQWRALNTIHKQYGITQVGLATSIDADAMTVSGILDRLEKRGLIERVVHPDDSRAKLSRLTPDGVELFLTSRALGAKLFESALDGFSEEEQATLFAGLTRIRTNLTKLDQTTDDLRDPT